MKEKKLINYENLTGDKSRIWGDAENIHGDVYQLKGDVSNIYGDISKICGNVSNIDGDVSNIIGNVTDLQGSATEIKGNVVDIINKSGFNSYEYLKQKKFISDFLEMESKKNNISFIKRLSQNLDLLRIEDDAHEILEIVMHMIKERSKAYSYLPSFNKFKNQIESSLLTIKELSNEIEFHERNIPS